MTADTGLLETGLRSLQFRTEFENSDGVSADVANSYELLQEPFEIAPGVILPVGGYDFTDVQVSYKFGQHRRASGAFRLRAGSFWNGNIKAVEFTRGRVEILEQLSIEPSVSVNWVDLPEGWVGFIDFYELLQEPFEIAPDVTIPVGGYSFSDVEISYGFGAQRRASGMFSVRAGSFWSGDIRTVAFNQGRVEILERLSVEPSVSVNWIDLPQGSFRTELARVRINYSFTPRMLFSGLLQYNSSGDSLSTNLRLRWEYTSGSELFIVYTDDRDTDPLMPERFSELRNRGLVVKITRLFRF